MALVMATSNPMQAFERQHASPAWRPGLPPPQASSLAKAPLRPETSATPEAFAACAQHPGLLFFHAGAFHAELAQAATQRLRQRLAGMEAPPAAKERLLCVFIELTHHLARRDPEAEEPQGRIAVGGLGEHFWVLCSRRLTPARVLQLRPHLEAVRRMSAEELARHTPAGHRFGELTETLPSSLAQASDELDPAWLQVARHCSAPIEYGFSGPQSDGGAQLHVRAWI